jgi:soluble lytic murein transglycosylase-like protein
MIKILTGFVVALVFSQATLADVYKYTAADGSVYYTDEPPNQKYTRIIRTKVIVRVRHNVAELNEISNGRHSLRFSSYNKRGFKSSIPSFSARVNRQKYTNLIAKAALDYGVDEKLLHAVIQAESAYNPEAVSPAGAVGLMQLMPDTAMRYGVKVEDRTNPAESIKGGARYLRDLLKMFDSNLSLAVAGYNAGEGAVKKYNNSIPPYPETQNYVAQVLAFYQR